MDPVNTSDYDVYIDDGFLNTTLAAHRLSSNYALHAGVKIAYLIISTIGIAGNLLVIAVILNLSAMRKWFTNILILNQSVIDLTASAFLLLIVFSPDNRIPQRRLSGFVDEVLCRVWYRRGPMWGALVASSYNLIAIAFERYFAVVRPIVYRNMYSSKIAKIVCLLPWVIALLFVSISFGVYGGRCVSIGAAYKSKAGKVFSGTSTLLLVFVIPTAIYIFCYTSMYKSLRRITPVQSEPGQVRQRQDRMRRVRQNILKTQVMVVVAFITCWSLNQVMFGAFNFGFQIDLTSPLYYTSVILTFADCCINPFIYTIKYEMFQNGVRKLLWRSTSTYDDGAETATNDPQAASTTLTKMVKF